MLNTSSTRRAVALAAAATAMLMTGACKSSSGSENKGDENGEKAAASPSAAPSSAAPVDNGVAAKPAVGNRARGAGRAEGRQGRTSQGSHAERRADDSDQPSLRAHDVHGYRPWPAHAAA